MYAQREIHAVYRLLIDCRRNETRPGNGRCDQKPTDVSGVQRHLGMAN